MSDNATVARDRPATGTGTVFDLSPPVLGTAVTRAVIGVSVELRMAIEAVPAGAPGEAGAAGQYHVALSAPTGAAVGISPAATGSAEVTLVDRPLP